MDLMIQVARLQGDLAGLREDIENVKADSALDAPERTTLVLKLRSRLLSAARRLEELDARIAATPVGNSLMPYFAGLNPDSLARVLARQMEQAMRALGNRFEPLLPELVARGGRLPSVAWSEHAPSPLPALVTRNFNSVIQLPAGMELLTLTHRFGDISLVPTQDGALSIEGQVGVTGNLSDGEARMVADSVRLETEMGVRSAIALHLPALHTGQSVGIRVDLVVKVPPGTPLQIRNSYGDVSVSGLSGRFDCTVSFGDLLAEGLGGGVHLAVGNGTLRATRITGPLAVESQMGVVQLRELGGEVSLNCNNTEVNLSGARAGGSLQFASGSIDLRDIGASLQVSGQNAPVSIEGVRGGVTLNTQYCAVRVAQVSGPLSAQCISGSLATSFVQQAQDLQTRFCQVEVTNPGGDVQAHGESAPMLLRLPEGLGPRRYDTTVRNGSVTLEVPDNCSAAIHASTNSGSILSDLPLSRQDTGDWQSGQTTLGRGESQVSVGGPGASVRISRFGH